MFTTEDVKALEALLAEYYSPQVQKHRQTEIDQKLTALQSQPDAWQDAVVLLRSPVSPYALFFALAVVSKRKDVIPADVRHSLKEMLLGTMGSLSNVPFFVRNKLVQVIASLIKMEPTGVDGFKDRLYGFLQDASFVDVGIQLVSELEWSDETIQSLLRNLLERRTHVENIIDCISKLRLTHPSFIAALYSLALSDRGQSGCSALGTLSDLSVPIDSSFMTSLLTSAAQIANQEEAEDYVSQVVHLFNLFPRTSLHLCLGDMQLLSAAYTFTFSFNNNSEYLTSCLEFWIQWLDIVSGKNAISQDVCSALVQSVLRAMLASQSPSLVLPLDDTSVDVFNDTERSAYWRRCAECIHAVAGHFPSLCLQVLNQLLSSYVQRLSGSPSLSEAFVLDVVAILSAVEHVAVFGSMDLRGLFSFSASLLQSLVQLQQLINVHRLFSTDEMGSRLAVAVQSAISSFCPWLEKFKSSAEDSPDEMINLQMFDSVVSTILESALFTLGASAPIAVLDSSAKLFRQFCTSLRPTNLRSYASVQSLFAHIQSLFASGPNALPVRVQQTLMSIVCIVLLDARDGSSLVRTPSGQDMRIDSVKTSDELNDRLSQCSSIINSVVVAPFLQHIGTSSLSSVPAASAGHAIVADVVRLMALAESVASFARSRAAALKARLLQALHPILSPLLEIAKVNMINGEMAEAIFDTIIAITDAFRRPLGVEYLARCVVAVISFFDSISMYDYVQAYGRIAAKVLVKTLRFFTTILQDGKQASYETIEAITSFVIRTIYPLMSDAQRMAADVIDIALEFYCLLHVIFADNWRAFFLPSMSECHPVSGRAAELVNSFLSIYLRALQARELSTFDLVLSHLLETNKVRRLFERPFFLEHFRAPFLVALMQALQSDDLALRKDQICLAIFEISNAVTTSNFRESFVALIAKELLPSSTPADCMRLLSLFPDQFDAPTFMNSIDNIAKELRTMSKPFS